ncbi:MAG: VanZ family protein [Coriobacteriales bacterium]|nr:VanZ family protein [Coriobacteriales bacterium]
MTAILDAYLFPIGTALVLMPAIAAACALPYAIYSYRRYGAISLLRTLVFVSFIFYIQCAYYLVILPLPDPATMTSEVPLSQYVQPIPFHFVTDILSSSGLVLSEPGTWPGALKSFAVLQVLFNVALTVPWGVYLAWYFQLSLKRVLLLSLALSLFFEISQLTGLFGLYPHPYRLFDVDDLLMNTAGGLVGFGIAHVLGRALPSRERINKHSRQRAAQVGYLRRFVAFLVDGAIVALLQILVYLVLPESWPQRDLAAYAIALCAYSMLVPAVFAGRTFGKALVRIAVRRAEGSKGGLPLPLRIVLRYLLRNIVLVGLALCTAVIAATDDQLIPLVIQLALVLLLVGDLLWGLRHGKRLIYERLSGTSQASSII